ncbi:hypothetical protein CFC21_024339, partial [Triticum aestivum]
LRCILDPNTATCIDTEGI